MDADKEKNGTVPLLTQQLGNMGLNNLPVLQQNETIVVPFQATPTLVIMDEDSEDEENYQYHPPRSPSKLPLPPSFEQELKEINTQLAPNSYPNFSEYTPFYIPFYRGVHYLKELFPTHNDRKNHRLNSKAGSPLFCSAAYTLCDKKFLDQDIDIILLEKNSRLIAKILGKFKTNYIQYYYKFHEDYSNDHIKFHDNLSQVLLFPEVLNTSPLYPFYVYKYLFNEIVGLDSPAKQNAFIRNPFVSCSMTIKHALKYAFGLKSFNGNPLQPDYKPAQQGSPNLKPTHPYLGMLYTILIDPLNLLNSNPTSIIGAQQEKQLQVSYAATNNILSEYEVSFFGWIPPQYVFSTVPVRVPNFKLGRPAYHQTKYGLKPTKKITLSLKEIFEKTSKHLISIIERKVQDTLIIKYPNFPIYQAYWRPDGKFGPSLISTTIVMALREQNISLFPNYGKQKIHSRDLEYLGEMLLTAPHIQVEIKDYALPLLSPMVMSSLAQSLQKGIITHLTLTKVGINELLKAKPMFWSKLLHNNKLQYLDLSSNRMGNNPMLCIAHELFHNSHLKTLKIGGNADNYLSASTLGLALADNNFLTELDYSYNNLALLPQQDGILSLCNGLSHNTTLKKLNLTGNFINNEHCTMHLIKLTNLTDLKLINNNITDNNSLKILQTNLNKVLIPFQ